MITFNDYYTFMLDALDLIGPSATPSANGFILWQVALAKQLPKHAR